MLPSQSRFTTLYLMLRSFLIRKYGLIHLKNNFASQRLLYKALRVESEGVP